MKNRQYLINIYNMNDNKDNRKISLEDMYKKYSNNNGDLNQESPLLLQFYTSAFSFLDKLLEYIS